MARRWLVLAGLVLTSCVAPRPSTGPGGADVPPWRARLDATASDPAARLAALDEALAQAGTPRERAEIELERGRSLQRLGRSLSAKTSLMRAWSEVAPSAAGLGGEIQLAWADAEYLSGARISAVGRWEALLSMPGVQRVHLEQAWASLAAASQARGDTLGAQSWRARLGPRGDRLVASAVARLVRERPAPVVTAAPMRGTIPHDPRSLDPAMHLRGDWRARPMRSNYRAMEPIHAITVHHSVTSQPGVGRSADLLRLIQANHQDDEGWADIGYHFLIDPRGEVWEGRPLVAQGAHAGSSESNRGNIGVCLMGNFEVQSVPPAQEDALLRLLDSLREHFALDRDVVYPHNRYTATVCPGVSLARIVERYRAG